MDVRKKSSLSFRGNSASTREVDKSKPPRRLSEEEEREEETKKRGR